MYTSYSIQIGPARFRAPEVLFRPDLIGEECEGLHEVLTYSIQKSDLDLRKVLFQNIVLSGGSTLFRVSTKISIYKIKKESKRIHFLYSYLYVTQKIIAVI